MRESPFPLKFSFPFAAMLSERVTLADEIVKEYLTRQGFGATLIAFEADAEADALQGFQVGTTVTISA